MIKCSKWSIWNFTNKMYHNLNEDMLIFFGPFDTTTSQSFTLDTHSALQSLFKQWGKAMFMTQHTNTTWPLKSALLTLSLKTSSKSVLLCSWSYRYSAFSKHLLTWAPKPSEPWVTQRRKQTHEHVCQCLILPAARCEQHRLTTSFTQSDHGASSYWNSHGHTQC